MALTALLNSKQKKGQNPSGGIGKERPKEKKDAKALFDEAKAQEREIQEQQDPDAILTEKRKRDQAKADKVAGGLFVQDDGQTQETNQESITADITDKLGSRTQNGRSNGPPGYDASGLANPTVRPSTEEVPPSQRLQRDRDDTPEDEMEDKWSDARFRKKHGLGPEDLRAVGTVRCFGNGKMLVMANGPKHATIYRLYKVKGEMAGFNVPGLPDLLENRIKMQEIETVKTETKGTKGKKSKPNFKYGLEHARGIQGVAWYVVESVLRDYPDYFARPVDLVKPKTKPSDFPVTKYDEEGVLIGRMKIVDCVIKIRWEIDRESISS